MPGWPEGPQMTLGLRTVLSSEVLFCEPRGHHPHVSRLMLEHRHQRDSPPAPRQLSLPGHLFTSSTLPPAQLPHLRIPLHLNLPSLCCCGWRITLGTESSGLCCQGQAPGQSWGRVSGPSCSSGSAVGSHLSCDERGLLSLTCS